MKVIVAVLLASIAFTSCKLAAQTLQRTSLVIIDGELESSGIKVTDPRIEVKLVTIASRQNPLAVIDSVIKASAPLRSLHIITKGRPGALLFRRSRIDVEALEKNVEILKSWRKFLPDGGDILLYGSGVANGVPGVNFVNIFSSITGVDIAASSSPSGPERGGTDWNLEYAVGEIEANNIFSRKNGLGAIR